MTPKTVIILIHGYNVKLAENTVGKLLDCFRKDFGVYSFDYGYTNLLQIRLRNRSLAKKLARLIKEFQRQGRNVIVVGHSNGCTIAHLAHNHYGAVVSGVIAINPALKRDIHPAPGARVHVYHNEQDKVVAVAKWLRRFSFCKARPWGEMGRYGYLGDSGQVENYCTAHDFDKPALGHSGVFDDDVVRYYAGVFKCSIKRLLHQ